MYHNGVAMADRYRHDHTHFFQDHWDIKAFSTNYLRTVKSCQTFLDGLLSNNSRNSVRCADRKKNDSVLLDYKQPTHYESIDLEEYRKTNKTSDSSSSSMIEIKVRDGKEETLNAFDRSPELMKDLMRDVVATPDFIEKDTRAAPLKAQLFDFIPGLSRYSSHFGKSSPSAINWIDAADHFVCRSSHSLPVTRFCAHLEYHDTTPSSAEEQFESLGRETLSHLLSRFRSYYMNPSLLAEMAGPALDEIRLEMKQVVETTNGYSNSGGGDDGANEYINNNSKSNIGKKPFRVYSCHDVTLLGILYAMKDRFLSEDTDRFRSLSSRWPSYATCLTFELVKLKAKEKGNDDTFVVKLYLNEAPIPKFRSLPVSIVAAPYTEPTEAIDLADFNKLIDELNGGRLSL